MEIESKIHNLTLHPPAIELMSQRERIIQSGLTKVFAQHEIEKALESETFNELSYQPGE